MRSACQRRAVSTRVMNTCSKDFVISDRSVIMLIVISAESFQLAVVAGQGVAVSVDVFQLSWLLSIMPKINVD